MGPGPGWIPIIRPCGSVLADLAADGAEELLLAEHVLPLARDQENDMERRVPGHDVAGEPQAGLVGRQRPPVRIAQGIENHQAEDHALLVDVAEAAVHLLEERGVDDLICGVEEQLAALVAPALDAARAGQLGVHVVEALCRADVHVVHGRLVVELLGRLGLEHAPGLLAEEPHAACRPGTGSAADGPSWARMLPRSSDATHRNEPAAPVQPGVVGADGVRPVSRPGRG